jgi:hypothetical protein
MSSPLDPLHSVCSVQIRQLLNIVKTLADRTDQLPLTEITCPSVRRLKCETTPLVENKDQSNQGKCRSEFHPLLKPNQYHAAAGKNLVLSLGSKSQKQTLRRCPEQERCMKRDFQLKLVGAPLMIGQQ